MFLLVINPRVSGAFIPTWSEIHDAFSAIPILRDGSFKWRSDEAVAVADESQNVHGTEDAGNIKNGLRKTHMRTT